VPTTMITATVPPTTIPAMHPAEHFELEDCAVPVDGWGGDAGAATSSTLLAIVGGGMEHPHADDSSEYHAVDVSLFRASTFAITLLIVAVSLAGICAWPTRVRLPAARTTFFRRNSVTAPPLDT